MEIFSGFFPVAEIDEVIPIGDLIVDGAASVAIGDAAIHAAGSLFLNLGRSERDDKFLIILHPIFDGLVFPVGAVDLQKPPYLAHSSFSSSNS
jgi:hypothetical protein